MSHAESLGFLGYLEIPVECVEDLFHTVKLANSWVLHACLVCMH
jgi:hypothetical protein